MGRYQMSLGSWIWTLERNPMLEMVPVTKDNPVLCLIPKPPEVDPGLFIRPFTSKLSVFLHLISSLFASLISFKYFR